MVDTPNSYREVMDPPVDTRSGPVATDVSIGWIPAGEWSLSEADLAGGRGELRELVCARLRRMVLTGIFPTRWRLREEALADILGVSRTPVREALVRLHVDRLVVRSPGGGYYVAELDLERLRDLYELRITLELRGLTRSLEGFGDLDVAVLEPLRDQWRGLRADLPAPDAMFVEVDESFHVALSRATGNHVLTQMLETVNDRIRPVRMHDFLTEDRIEATVSEHLGIVAALLDRDVPRALDRMRAHVGESMSVVEGRAAAAITTMALHRRSW